MTKHRTITESHNGSNNQQLINNKRTTAIEWTAAKTTGGGLECILLVPNAVVEAQKNVELAWKIPNYCNVSSEINNIIKLTHYDKTEKRAPDSDSQS